MDEAKAKVAKATQKAKAPAKAAATKESKVKVPEHKHIDGVNPKKAMTLYNGFLGFKEPKKGEPTKVNNDLKEYWNGYNGKKGCKGKHCHKLRIDALRSCDKEGICRITQFD